MVGVIATVLVQSSSTSTSITIAMVSAELLTTTQAIYIIMGANIGTSVTNTIVSHVHITDSEEFKRGFMGATVHDAFNFLTVLILFPAQVATNFLGVISDSVAEAVLGADLQKWDSPVKMVTKPATKHFIGINKDLIKEIAKGCVPCKKDDDDETLCKNYQKVEDEYVYGTVPCADSTCYDVKKDKETGDKCS